MFGEELIIGEQEGRIAHQTNKFYVPSFTGVEPEEILVLVNSNKGYLNLYSRTYIDKIRGLEKKLEESTDSKDIEKLLNLRKKLEYFYASTIATKKVSDKKEFIIPKLTVERYFPNHSIYVVGDKDHIRLYRSKQAYESSIQRTRVQK